MKGAHDFEALRQSLDRAGWALRRTDATDGPVSFYAERGRRVRHLPDLAAVAALADALAGAGRHSPAPTSSGPLPPGFRRRRAAWRGLLPSWATPRHEAQWLAPGYAGPRVLNRLRLELRAGIVDRVRAEMPTVLVHWLEQAGAEVWCESQELDAYPEWGSAWQAWVAFPWGRPADEFLAACDAMSPRPRVRFDGCTIDRRRLMAWFSIHGPAVPARAWRDLIGGDA